MSFGLFLNTPNYRPGAESFCFYLLIYPQTCYFLATKLCPDTYPKDRCGRDDFLFGYASNQLA